MRSSYKLLGDYITLVDERNVYLEVTTLLGLSISKQFIPSVANIIGTDMKNYKIIRKNQFACSVMQVRRDGKMPVALLKDFDEAIISQAYPVFEVNDPSLLLPDYLMMWFTRSEFDRQATFHAVGGVRGSLEWEDFMDFELPVPSIEKQHEIVKEYNVVANRIKLNEQLNQKLEETAQALYKHWFVDFEFPVARCHTERSRSASIDGINNEINYTKGYKSSGGAMVYNEELDEEIPAEWGVYLLGAVAEISAGGDKPKIFSKTKTDNCLIPIYSNSSKDEGLYGFTNISKIKFKSITISARGAIIGFTRLRTEPFVPIVRLIVVTPKYEYHVNFLYKLIEHFEYNIVSSAQGQLTVPEISSFQILLPLEYILKQYQNLTTKLDFRIKTNNGQISNLEKLSKLLLAKMATVGSEVEILNQ